MYKVLIADDEPYVIEGLELMVDWKGHGFEIADKALSGLTALDKIKASEFDLIIVDINMPGMDGLELIDNIMKHGYQGEIIILTGYTMVEYARRAMTYGVKYFVNKPVDTDDFHDILSSIKKTLDKRGKIRGVIDKREGLAAAYRRSVILGLSDASINGIMVIDIGDDALDESVLPQKVYIYEYYAKYISLIIGIDGDFNTVTQAVFDALKEKYPDIVAVRKETAGEDISACILKALNNIRYKVHREKSTLYDAKERSGRVLSPMEISEYADKVIAETELCNYGGAKHIIDEFFSVMEDGAEPENYAVIFSSYMLVHFNRLVIKNAGDSDEIIGENLSFKNEPMLDMKHYYHSIINICRGTIECQEQKRAEEEIDASAVVEKYIREHFREQIVIQDIAKNLFTSPGYLGTVFSKKMGVNIKEYLHAVRLEEAVRLINETDMSLSEIAYETGYNNYNNFYHRFERFFGVSPKEYRNMLEEKGVR